jgi:hypothetical protein
MLFAGDRPTFATSVGVAPATTTMTLPGPVNGFGTTRYLDPYASMEELRASSGGNAGLGLINETDAWLTGRPYGLPGTATIRIDHHARNGAEMLGGAMFGEMTATDMVALLKAQDAQAAALKRIAYWQAFFGVAAVAGLVLGVGQMAYRVWGPR